MFIPIAEETGLIGEIGKWVMREACRQMQEWHAQFGWNIPVSVNLSTQQFHQEQLASTIKDILKETNLPPAFLSWKLPKA